jgi:hypothetical protein
MMTTNQIMLDAACTFAPSSAACALPLIPRGVYYQVLPPDSRPMPFIGLR